MENCECVHYSNNKYVYICLLRGRLSKRRQSHIVEPDVMCIRIKSHVLSVSHLGGYAIPRVANFTEEKVTCVQRDIQ
jgi:hypothetical protein